MPGDFLRQIENFQHGRTSAHDAVKQQVVQELVFQIANLRTLCKVFRQIVESLHQPCVIHGLAEKIVSAVLDSLNSRIHRIVAGDEYDEHSRVTLQHFLKKSQAVHSGHFYVGDYYTACTRPDGLQGVRSEEHTS